MATTREALVDQLQAKAYYGVAAVMSLGHRPGRSGVQGARTRSSRMPRGCAPRDAASRRRSPAARTSRTGSRATAEARKAVQELAAQEGRLRQDLGRRSRRQVQEADAGALWRGHRRGPQAQAPRHRPHLFARGREGAAEGRARRLRARRARQGHRRRVRRADEGAPAASSWCRTCPIEAWRPTSAG